MPELQPSDTAVCSPEKQRCFLMEKALWAILGCVSSIKSTHVHKLWESPHWPRGNREGTKGQVALTEISKASLHIARSKYMFHF